MDGCPSGGEHSLLDYDNAPRILETEIQGQRSQRQPKSSSSSVHSSEKPLNLEVTKVFGGHTVTHPGAFLVNLTRKTLDLNCFCLIRLHIAKGCVVVVAVIVELLFLSIIGRHTHAHFYLYYSLVYL